MAIGYPELIDTFAAHAVKDAWWDWLDVGTRVEQVVTPSHQIAGSHDLILRGGLGRDGTGRSVGVGTYRLEVRRGEAVRSWKIGLLP
jgi:hypothetical protein